MMNRSMHRVEDAAKFELVSDLIKLFIGLAVWKYWVHCHTDPPREEAPFPVLFQ